VGRRPVGPPPPKFAAAPKQAAKRPPSRELGPDPEAERAARAARRPWLVWALAGAGALAAVVLVVSLVVSSLGAPAQPTAPSSAPLPPAEGGPAPTSNYATAQPVVPQPGLVPLTVDAKFPSLAFAMPQVGTWEQRTNDRAPDQFYIYDPKSRDQLIIESLKIPTSAYRDQDLSASDLGTAPNTFRDTPKVDGAPTTEVIHGQGGYDLEVAAQRLTWGDGSVALYLTRVMPQSGMRISITIITTESRLADRGSAVWQKLQELTFTP